MRFDRVWWTTAGLLLLVLTTATVAAPMQSGSAPPAQSAPTATAPPATNSQTPSPATRQVLGIQVQDLTNILIALCTLFYTIASFLLWRATRATLGIVERQTAFMEAATKSETAYRISAAHREMFLAFLGNPLALQILAGDVLTPDETQRVSSENGLPILRRLETTHRYLRAQMATLLINHVADVFQSFQRQHLEQSDWDGLQNDIRDLLDWPFVQERWTAIETFYSQDFRDFIGGLRRSPGVAASG